jgi:hypothetical protein
MVRYPILLISLIFNISIGYSQNRDLIKFRPEFYFDKEDTIVKHLDSNIDSLAFYGIDDTEFCIQFSGGEKALGEYLIKSIIIPRDSITSNIEGKVYVSFTVNERGKVGNVIIENGLYAPIDTVIFKAISRMPDWIWNCKETPKRKITIKRYIPISIRQDKDKK